MRPPHTVPEDETYIEHVFAQVDVDNYYVQWVEGTRRTYRASTNSPDKHERMLEAVDGSNLELVDRSDEDHAGYYVEVYVPPPSLKRLASLIESASAARGVDLYATDYRGYSDAEWAEMTGRNRSTVSRNTRRGRSEE